MQDSAVQMRIRYRGEGELLHDGVNLSQGIHFWYVIIFRGNSKMEIVLPKERPQEYSFYDWVSMEDNPWTTFPSKK